MHSTKESFLTNIDLMTVVYSYEIHTYYIIIAIFAIYYCDYCKIICIRNVSLALKIYTYCIFAIR